MKQVKGISSLQFFTNVKQIEVERLYRYLKTLLTMVKREVKIPTPPHTTINGYTSTSLALWRLNLLSHGTEQPYLIDLSTKFFSLQLMTQFVTNVDDNNGLPQRSFETFGN